MGIGNIALNLRAYSESVKMLLEELMIEAFHISKLIIFSIPISNPLFEIIF